MTRERISCLLLDVGELPWLLPVSMFREVVSETPANCEIIDWRVTAGPMEPGDELSASAGFFWAVAETQRGPVAVPMKSLPRLMQIAESDLSVSAGEPCAGVLMCVDVLGVSAVIPDLESSKYLSLFV